MVAPLAGAWIEIANVNGEQIPAHRSLPSRERGLKFRDGRTSLVTQVAPLAGAWIEILQASKFGSSNSSLPSRERGLK